MVSSLPTLDPFGLAFGGSGQYYFHQPKQYDHSCHVESASSWADRDPTVVWPFSTNVVLSV